jgi:amino acid transporter
MELSGQERAKIVTGSLVPTLNFAMMLALIVGALYLSGTLVMFNHCPLDEEKGYTGACTIISEKRETCKDWRCQGWTITVIAVSAIWFMLQIPMVGKAIACKIEDRSSNERPNSSDLRWNDQNYILNVRRRYMWASILFGLPVTLGIITLGILALIMTVQEKDEQVEPNTLPEDPSEGPAWGLFGMLFLVGIFCFIWSSKREQCMTWAAYLSNRGREVTSDSTLQDKLSKYTGM